VRLGISCLTCGESLGRRSSGTLPEDRLGPWCCAVARPREREFPSKSRPPWWRLASGATAQDRGRPCVRRHPVTWAVFQQRNLPVPIVAVYAPRSSGRQVVVVIVSEFPAVARDPRTAARRCQGPSGRPAMRELPHGGKTPAVPWYCSLRYIRLGASGRRFAACGRKSGSSAPLHSAHARRQTPETLPSARNIPDTRVEPSIALLDARTGTIRVPVPESYKLWAIYPQFCVRSMLFTCHYMTCI